MLAAITGLMWLTAGAVQNGPEIGRLHDRLNAEKSPKARIEIIDRLIALESGDDLVSLQMQLGKEYCALQEPKPAEKAFAAATKLAAAWKPERRFDLESAVGEAIAGAHDPNVALDHYRQARKIAVANSLTECLVAADIALGQRSRSADDQKESYLNAIEEAQAARLIPYVSIAQVGLGQVCYESEDYERAIYYTEKGMTEFLHIEPSSAFDINHKLAICAGYRGDTARAEKYGGLAVAEAKKNGLRADAAMIENDIAFAYDEANDPKGACWEMG